MSSTRSTTNSGAKKLVRPYGDTTGDGMVQMSFTLPVPHDKRAEGAALQLAAKMGMEPAMLVHAKAMGPDFTFFVVYGSVTHLVDLSEVKVARARVPAARRQGGQRDHQDGAAPQAGRRRRLHRHRRAHGRHRRDPQHQGLRRREGPRVLPGGQGREPRRPGARARARRPGARGEGRRGAGVPGRHPARRAPDTTPARCRRRSARRTPRAPPRCWSSAGRASTSTPPASSASTGSSAAARRPARSRATSCTRCMHDRADRRLTAEQRRGPDDRRRPAHRADRHAPSLRARTRTPTTPATSSTARTRSALFGDVATEVCIRTDGDEGLFASYSDVQFRAPVQAGDVVEVQATVTRVGTRSRELAFEARVVCRGARARRAGAGASAAEVLDPPIVATTARRHRRGPSGELTDHSPLPGQWSERGICGQCVSDRHAETLADQGKILAHGIAAPTCGFAHRRRSARRLTDPGGDDRVATSTTGHPHGSPPRHTSRLRARDGAMRKRRPGARSDRRRRHGRGG